MTKSEIVAKIGEWESLRDEHREAEDRSCELFRKREDARRVLCEGLVAEYGRGHIRVGGIIYYVDDCLFYPIIITDLDSLPGSDGSDSRCYRSINPDLDPADLEGICVGGEAS